MMPMQMPRPALVLRLKRLGKRLQCPVCGWDEFLPAEKQPQTVICAQCGFRLSFGKNPFDTNTYLVNVFDDEEED